MANTTANISRDTPIHGTYQGNTEDITKELQGVLGSRIVKPSDPTGYTQYQNKDSVIDDNEGVANREVISASDEDTSRKHFSSENDINRQQAEDLYDTDILPKVKKIFSCRNNEDAPIIGIIHVLKTNTNTENVINFLYNDPDTISGIIEEGGSVEFTAVIDLLLNKINNTDITEKQSRQAFFVLNKLYKKLPEIAYIKPSSYGKMHYLFSLLLKYNRQDVINTLTEAMTSEHSNKYFSLYINKNGAIENNYLSLITEIYASPQDNQESDNILFEKLLTFLGANDLVEKDINSAKALHLAIAISNIVSNFDESHQEIFIKYFLKNPIDNNKLDDLLLQTLKQNRLLEKHDIVISNKKDISKISPYEVIDYTLEKDQEIPISNKIDDKWLLEDIESDRKQQILLMIDKLDVYNCHTLADYLSSPDNIVFQKVIASKSVKVYEQMIDLLVTKLKTATTISTEDSNKIIELLKQLHIRLPSVGTKAQPLCSKIYEAFNLLLPQNIVFIREAIFQATKSNTCFYSPLSVTKNKKVTSNFLDLVAKIYETRPNDYKLLNGMLEDIKSRISDDKSDHKILFISEKLYKIIVELPNAKQSKVIESLLDSPKLSVNMKYYLCSMLHDNNISIPDCTFQPLDKLSIESTKKQMELIRSRNPDLFQ